MSKSIQGISVLTANRLGDGIVVFLGHDGVWVESFAGAAPARSPEEARALEARGAYDAAHNVVVEPYLIDVHEVAGRLTPVRVRERVRVAGPSILDDVPGYAAPFPSPRPLRGEGQGEGRPHNATRISAPHPNPLPVKDGEREQLVEAA